MPRFCATCCRVEPRPVCSAYTAGCLARISHARFTHCIRGRIYILPQLARSTERQPAAIYRPQAALALILYQPAALMSSLFANYSAGIYLSDPCAASNHAAEAQAMTSCRSGPCLCSTGSKSHFEARKRLKLPRHGSHRFFSVRLMIGPFEPLNPALGI